MIRVLQIIFMVVGLLIVPFGEAQAEDQVKRDFKAANDRLLEGDAKGALALYEHLKQQSIVNPDLYYNMGNAYAALNRPVDAVIAYERSLLLDPGAESTQHNLAQLRKSLDVRYDQVATEDLPSEPMDTVRSLIGGLDENTFAWLLVLANLGLFLGLGVLRYAPRNSLRNFAVVGVGASLICLVFAGVVTIGHYALSKDRLGVLTANIDLKSGPNKRFEATDNASIGSRVRILDTQKEWLEIKTRLGTIGWIPKSKMTEL